MARILLTRGEPGRAVEILTPALELIEREELEPEVIGRLQLTHALGLREIGRTTDARAATHRALAAYRRSDADVAEERAELEALLADR